MAVRHQPNAYWAVQGSRQTQDHTGCAQPANGQLLQREQEKVGPLLLLSTCENIFKKVVNMFKITHWLFHYYCDLWQPT